MVESLPPWLNAALQRLLTQRGHAWLLTGAAGLGQFDLSMALAASWLCERPVGRGSLQATACGHCEACFMIKAKSHPDLMVLLPETLALTQGWPLDQKTQEELDDKKRKPSKQIKMEAVQSLINFVQRTDARGKGLVVVIYPAERMNNVSSSALLKSLEEPAGHTRFVLATEDSVALLPTIRSRCQSFVLTRPSDDLAVAWLIQHGGMSERDATIWLKAAGGQPQTALALGQALVETSAWAEFPKLVAKGVQPSELPAALVETPAVLVGALHKLCHDWLCMVQGSQPRFFERDVLQSALPQLMQEESRQSATYKLTMWSKALNAQVRSAEHTLHAALMMEALLSQAKQAVAYK